MLGAGALLFKLCRFAVCFLQNLSGSGGKSGAFLLADGVLRGNQLLNQLKYLFFLCFALCEKLGLEPDYEKMKYYILLDELF